ncbi:hypothetical protein [Massilia sp. IC2-476]|uniref:hypothetical protein n=1 Tax=Massilia sp. IC2-476 TaxID=2887199 RepID=UPI001D111B4F|nr:hypothetical protein [Massilia sp. IC2-476]MCC2972915.1 hypothetical protein [Massilia sp. IC2-476]
MTTTTTTPARFPADWFKLGAVVITAFIVSWAIALWYWHQTGRDPGTGELALGLLVLPMGILFGLWASQKAVLGRAAPSPSVTAKPASPTARVDAAPASPVLALVASALRSPHGTSAEELASAIADNEARADLDKELVDDNGFPVMTARSDDAQDDTLQDEIADWLASQGMQLRLSDQEWRALTLATGVAAELGSQAAGDLLPSEGNPPMLQLKLMLPHEWTIEVRRAATMWLKHTVSQYGWPEASITTSDIPDQEQATPTTLLAQLMPVASSNSRSQVAIVLACASLIGQESVDRLAAQSALFKSSQSRGQIPGEGAAGLLLTDLQLAHSCGAEFALLGPVIERRRDSSADEARRVDSTLLLDMVDQIHKAAAVDISQLNMVVADTAHRPNRVLELMGLSAPAIPQVDAADIVRIGLGSGSCGAVPFMTVLALARHYALERGAPILCIGNEDPILRSAALVRPPA